MKPKLNVVTPPMAAGHARVPRRHPADPPPVPPPVTAAPARPAPPTPPAAAREIVEIKEPTEAMIRQRAYELYIAGGCVGDAIGDWLRAEAELKEEFRKRTG